jgi:demethylmenaquinone methyltransferase/2-methoxy-6-polyprenyl-1,4-benzoquinol methylase
MPWTATLVSGDRSGAYRYLPKSVATFLTPDQLAGLAGDAGFTDLAIRPLTFGTCSIVRAVRPA